MLSSILPIASLVGVLIAGAAVVGQSFRVSHNTAAFNNLRDIAQGWEDKAKLQATQIEDLKQEKQSQAREISKLSGQVQVLKDTVTGKTELAELATQISGLIHQMETRSAELLAQVGEIRGEVRGMHTTLDDLDTRVART